MFAGRLSEFGHGVDVDLTKALALYERSCTLGYSGGCYNVAVLLEKERRDLARAAALYQRVCAAGSPIACAAAFRLAADGGAP
jgi:TPR repeat protein